MTGLVLSSSGSTLPPSHTLPPTATVIRASGQADQPTLLGARRNPGRVGPSTTEADLGHKAWSRTNRG